MKLSDALAEKRVKFWADVLQIDPIYKFIVKVNNAPDPEAKKSERKDTQAFVTVDQSYYFIRLTINAYEFDDGELDGVIAHELIHVVLAPIDTVIMEAMADFKKHATDLMESATERLAQAFVRLKGAE